MNPDQTKPAMPSNFDVVRDILVQTLQLSTDANDFTQETALLGSIPELDSMAVVTILTSLEDHFGFYIDDAEISAETFETLGSLVQFVDQKCSE